LWEIHAIEVNNTKNKLYALSKKRYFQNVIHESLGIKYAVTHYHIAWICHCWKNPV